ncbi:MAG: 3'(2'),5'-bisphosphate nucleotidase CysQ [Rhodospirillaceae bacterium]|nr:3'(2'),5'-bisphosphate nucleotidase CysQ [Rhodospirillaceae bacterium]MBT7266263.1 3'(2'),5'-bisphosphate nucleotidase CysQ [Rhodospirillaceae bacterium]
MTPNFNDDLVQKLRDLTIEAGAAILEIYHTDFEIRSKADSSPVTEADEKAEAIILAGLTELAPDIPAIGEEAYTAGVRPDISGGVFWLVDALDGTKEFVNKRDEFTVNIALIENGEPIFGIVYAPAIAKSFWGGDFGAYAQDADGEQRAISARVPAADGIVVVASRSHRAGEEEFLADYTVKEIINSGSSLKICLIAAGEADLYPRLGPTSEWDIAAGHAVLSAAGGSITQIDGAPFVYGKDNIRNPHFLAKGR